MAAQQQLGVWAVYLWGCWGLFVAWLSVVSWFMVAGLHGLSPPPEIDSMHLWFLLWYLFLGLCGCKPCLAEGLENLHKLDFFFFFPFSVGKVRKLGRILLSFANLQWICLVSLSPSPVSAVTVLGGMEEASLPLWFCSPEVLGAGPGERSSSCCPADQGLLVLLAKVPVSWIWGYL